MPSLLVSVRNAAEARSAIDGGCEILDVKEPARGSLGRADASQILAVLDVRNGNAPRIPVSVALGEALDSESSDEPVGQTTIPREVQFFKLGTAGLGKRGDWTTHFIRARRRWESRLTGAKAISVSTSNPPKSIADGLSPDPQWVAVAYADWNVAQSPPPAEIIGGAIDCGCSGLLIDTCSKSAGGLFEWFKTDELRRLRIETRNLGLWFALAGRLTVDDLSRIHAIQPDIVGIRSAACRGRRREDEVDPSSVRAFRQHMARVHST